MGRVAHQKSAKQTASANATRASKVSKQRKNHKVVIESDSQDKEKSRAVLSFRADPPAGYTFIPAGNPQLTSALKEFAKKGNHQIFAVTTTPHASRHELSREVHRIGFHFPTQIVAQVCNYYGIRLTSGGKLVEEKDDDKLFMKVYQKGQLALDEKVRDQVTINTEAKQIIKDLFPNIPDNDLFQIIKTAFQLGDGKVGTADEIPLVRRAQLSVVAHIRHCYTSYDKLLKQVPYSEARHRVESITLQKLIDWRGDDKDKQAMDDTLREVVVISDEEESDDDAENDQLLQHEHLLVRPVNGVPRPLTVVQGRPHSPHEINSDDEAPRGYRYVPQVVRRYPIADPQAVSVARQQSRYAVWDRMRQEYKTGAAPAPTRVLERVLLDNDRMAPIQPSFGNGQPYYVPEPEHATESTARIAQQPNPPTYFRGTDGKLYERITTHPDQVPVPTSLQRVYTPPPVEYRRHYPNSRPVSPQPQRAQLHRRTESYDNGDGTILPSIEGSNNVYQSPASRRNPFDQPQSGITKRYSDTFAPNHRQVPLIDLTNSAEQASKRRRAEGTPPSPYIQRMPEHTSYDYAQRGTGTNSSQRAHDIVPPEQRRYISLEMPPAAPDRTQKSNRAEPVMQSTLIYREEINEGNMSSPRGTRGGPLQTSGGHEFYQGLPSRRFEQHDHGIVRKYHNEVNSHLVEPIPQGRQITYASEPSVRYIRSENNNPFDTRGAPQYLVQDVPHERVHRDQAPAFTSQQVASPHDMTSTHYVVGGRTVQPTRTMTQVSNNYRDGTGVRTAYVQN